MVPVWAPGKLILATEPFCDSADASADIADASPNAFDETAGTSKQGLYTKHFCDASSRFVGWHSGALQFLGSALSVITPSVGCVAFVGAGLDWGFSVELAATSPECFDCEVAIMRGTGVGFAGFQATGLTVGSFGVGVPFVVEFVVEFVVVIVCSVF